MNIHQAMVAVMRDMTAVGKDSKNVQQGFNYRGIDAVYNALNPLLAKHGIFTTPEVLEKHREERVSTKDDGKGGSRQSVLAFTTLRVKYTFWSEDGSSVFCTVEGEGMDSGDKSSNKALAIAHKYALLQTFCVPTVEQVDPDSESHEVAPRRELKSRNGKKDTAYSQRIPEENPLVTQAQNLIDAATPEKRAELAERIKASDKFTQAEKTGLLGRIARKVDEDAFAAGDVAKQADAILQAAEKPAAEPESDGPVFVPDEQPRREEPPSEAVSPYVSMKSKILAAVTPAQRSRYQKQVESSEDFDADEKATLLALISKKSEPAGVA